MSEQTATVDGLMAPFESWLRRECFQRPTPEAYDLAKCAWREASRLAASAAVQAVPTVIHGVLAEVARATKKFPTWPTDPLHALAVLGEEFGELTKDMLQLTYEPHKTSAEKVQEEAIQTAAMALRLVMSLEQYRYAPCEQHKQQAAPADPIQRPGDHVPGGQA